MAKQTTDKTEHGALRVWWCPQIPCKAFHVPVRSLAEAVLVLSALARYDSFQLAENIKGDYANVGGLQIFDAQDTEDNPLGSWVEWHDDMGNDIDHYSLNELRRMQTGGTLPRWEMADRPECER